MEKYNYFESMLEDVKEYVNENELIPFEDEPREDYAERLHDTLWLEDSVTGNASGSYYCNAWRAENAICHNMDLLHDAFDEFGMDKTYLWSAEYCDVIIRCYLLSQVIDTFINESGYYEN